MVLPQSRTLIWHSLPQREHQTAENKIKLCTPQLSDFSFFCKNYQFKKNLHSYKSPSLTTVWKELDDFGTFIMLWGILTCCSPLNVKVLFFVVVSFHHTHTLQEVAQKSGNTNCHRGEEAHCPCSLNMKTLKELDLDWRSFRGRLEK